MSDKESLYASVSVLDYDSKAAERIRSDQDRREWVIDTLVPFLREHGNMEISDAARMLGVSIVKLASCIASARRYIHAIDLREVRDGAPVGKQKERLFLRLAPELRR